MAKALLTETRYKGLVCLKHPDFFGIRMKSNRKCVQCLAIKSADKVKQYRSVPKNVAKEAEATKRYRQNHLEDYRLNMHNYRNRRKGSGRLSRGLFNRLFDLQDGMCGCDCGRKLNLDIHMDHWMPLILGGSNSDDNIRLLTAFCNLSKGGLHPDVFIKQRKLYDPLIASREDADQRPP